MDAARDRPGTIAKAARPASLPTVIIASTIGTTFEWYDFFVFGTLTPVIAKNFFAELDPTAGLLAALALFGAGFFFRPIGALIFGRLGDRIGRKGAFLVTVTMMGGATFAIGLLPSYAQAGALSPLLLILMRILQGTALGGQYGGAAIYVAEHAPEGRRGFFTGWIQTSAALGLVAALGVIFVTRTQMGEARFTASGWDAGWRIPFLVSAALLAVSIWMRLRLTESPAFAKIRAAGGQSRAPYVEAFGRWENLKLVLTAFFSFMTAQGAAWYAIFFYAEQVFLERFLKIDPTTGVRLLLAISIASAPLYVFFAWLSDIVGRKWVMWGGLILALVAFFPGFHALTHLANPALERAQARTPVVVVADPARCSLQFDIIGKARFSTSCDLAKTALANAGVSYANAPAPAGAVAQVRVGGQSVPSIDATGLSSAQTKAAAAEVSARVKAALSRAGYPAKADPAQMNFWGVFGVMLIFVVAATALYGPQASCLVELFPTRIRYTALSLPYHLGTGWIGGFMPVTAFAIVTATGNIYSGLWYPVIFTALNVILLPLLLPETFRRRIDE
ncbi:MAG TPA: MFS transporter [Caulobacteraceae bacterium]|nr:MFS transporter [Caulobacteraceae bacterium]